MAAFKNARAMVARLRAAVAAGTNWVFVTDDEFAAIALAHFTGDRVHYCIRHRLAPADHVDGMDGVVGDGCGGQVHLFVTAVSRRVAPAALVERFVGGLYDAPPPGVVPVPALTLGRVVVLSAAFDRLLAALDHFRSGGPFVIDPETN